MSLSAFVSARMSVSACVSYGTSVSDSASARMSVSACNSAKISF